MSGGVLGVVPARAGSKGIPGKNSRELAGRPLLAYTADAALGAERVDRVVLSTDSEELAELGRSLGLEVPFLRPAELAADDTPMLPVVQHAIESVEGDGFEVEAVVLLQPTAPLRTSAHVDHAVAMLMAEDCSSVVSVVEIPKHYAPHYAMKIDDGRLVNFLPEGEAVTRRQDVVPAYSRDGTVYAIRRDVLMDEGSLYGSDCRALVLDESESLNLDTLADWQRAEALLA